MCHLNTTFSCCGPQGNPNTQCVPVSVGDERQAAIVPRYFPQNGKDEEQDLKKTDDNFLLPDVTESHDRMRDTQSKGIVDVQQYVGQPMQQH